VDDGSRDGTADIVRDFSQRDPRVSLLQVPNGGVSAARMTGFDHTNPDNPFIIFLDADDVWEPDTLETLRTALLADPEALGAHGLARLIDAQGVAAWPGEGEQFGRRRRVVEGGRMTDWPEDRPTTFEVMAIGNCLYTSGQLLLRREAFAASGGYRPGAKMAEDWEVWLRLTAAGHLAFVDQVVLGYRRHDSNVSSDKAWLIREINRIRREAQTAPWLSAPQREYVRTARRVLGIEAGRQHWSAAWQELTSGKILEGLREARRSIRDFTATVALSLPFLSDLLPF